MDYPLKNIDAEGKSLVLGDSVIFKKASEKLTKGLPEKDQKAIEAQAGKLMAIVGFDEYGHVEMEFTSEDGHIHTIWVEPQELFKR